MNKSFEVEDYKDNEKPVLTNYLDQQENYSQCQPQDYLNPDYYPLSDPYLFYPASNAHGTTVKNEEIKLKKRVPVQKKIEKKTKNTKINQEKKSVPKEKLQHSLKTKKQRQKPKQQLQQMMNQIQNDIQIPQNQSNAESEYLEDYKGTFFIDQLKIDKKTSQQNEQVQKQKRIQKKTKNSQISQTETNQEKTEKENLKTDNKSQSEKVQKKAIKKKDCHNYLQAFIKNFIKKYKSKNYKGVDWLIKQGKLIKKKNNISYKRYHLKQLQDQCLVTNTLAQTYLDEVFKEKIMDQVVHDRIKQLLKKRI